MAWIALKLEVPAATAEQWSDALFTAGALSVDIADADADSPDETPIFGEPGEPAPGIWAHNVVTALLPEGADAEAWVRDIAGALETEVPAFQTETIAEQDWVRLTQAQFDPIRISDRFWILPTWHEPSDPNALNLILDPGLAFGTGSHPTTRLCLRWLEANLAGGETVLDYGCGSGILAIAAKKLGAGPTLGTDIDPQAIIASKQNAEQNEVEAAFCLPDDVPGDPVDVLVANILTNPLKVLAPLLAEHVRPGGRIVLSGILAEQAEAVREVYSQWFNIGLHAQEEGWACLAGTKR